MKLITFPGRVVTFMQKDGYFLYKDDDHLSNAGAKLIAEKVLEQME